ncbi:MAG: DUF3307 domain-containing protein [Nostoc sp. C3-bin3]|jgi:hypothetical protein|nr:DUF3307 domain-containing protein [Nostoc sp. C3-bin3]
MIDFGLQFIAHRTGDFLLQNSFLALNKKKDWRVAVLHGLVYSLPFCFLTQKPESLILISGTHILIDFFNISSFWVRTYNWDWQGDVPKVPLWVMVEVDQTLHYAINYLALLF